MNEHKKEIPQMRDETFSKLALRVRRKRIIITAVLVAAAVLVAVGALNYKAAGRSASPPIAFYSEKIGACQTSVSVYYSLGFKQVWYESDYGKNYSQRLWPWEKIDTEPEALTAVQYRQLMKQLKAKYERKSENDEYLDVFKTYNAAILDLKKAGDEYTIYLSGAMDHFVEYGKEVYPLEPSDYMQPMVVTAVEKNDKLEIKDVREYALGGAGSGTLFKTFPKAAAMRLLTHVDGLADTREITVGRGRIDAAAHFGANIAEEKEMVLDTGIGVMVISSTIDPEMSEEIPLQKETPKKPKE